MIPFDLLSLVEYYTETWLEQTRTSLPRWHSAASGATITQASSLFMSEARLASKREGAELICGGSMFIAMNHFQVNDGQEAAFEDVWRERETQLKGVPGFVAFALLKNQSAAEGTTEYVSHSTWRAAADFDAWRNSEAFNRGHAQGSLAGILAGPPSVSLYEAVLQEDASGTRT
jgi:heme-degrading monooxygenase HmoA